MGQVVERCVAGGVLWSGVGEWFAMLRRGGRRTLEPPAYAQRSEDGGREHRRFLCFQNGFILLDVACDLKINFATDFRTFSVTF